MMNILGDVNVVSIAVACFVAIALVVVPLVRDGGGLSLIVWPAFGMAQILVGHAMLDEILENSFWPWYAASAVAVIVGYYLTARRQVSARVGAYAVAELEPVHKTLVAFAAVISFFVAYHFLVGGIPLLSSDVEVARFNFAGSGLFGIPGRMYLFGLPFLVTYASYVAARHSDPRVTRLRNLVWAEYAFAMVLSGFKGSLVVVIIQWLLIRAMLGAPVRVHEILKPRYVALALCALLFGGVMARQYESLELPGGSGSTVEYLAERVTVVAAAPGAIAVRELDRPNGTYLVDEIAYFTKKYFRVDLVDREVFPLDKVVSSTLLGTPLEEDEFVVSVTVGAYAAFVVDFGVWVSLALMLALGAFYGFLGARARNAISAFRFAALGMMIQAMYTIVVNGGLAYSIVNTVTMLLILGAIHWTCVKVSASRR